MREPTKLELAYCAGVLDSDGHIGVHANWYRVRTAGDAKQPTFQARVAVKQIDHGATALFAEVFGGHHYVDETARRRGSGRPMNVWNVHSRAAGVVLRQLRPYLRIKTRQADLVLELCAINSSPRRHRWELPEIVEGEPLVPLAEAAKRAGRSYATAIQSVGLGNIPFVRKLEPGQSGRPRIFVPESFIPTWRERGQVPQRSRDITERMEQIAAEVKSLNSGARGQHFPVPSRG